VRCRRSHDPPEHPSLRTHQCSGQHRLPTAASTRVQYVRADWTQRCRHLPDLASNHRPTANYISLLRKKLNALYPSTTFAFLPADINSQILISACRPDRHSDFGPDVTADNKYATALLQKVRAIPGAVDVRIQQALDYPQLNVDVDRSKAQLVGLTQSDVASNLLVSLSGSFQTSPSFWMDPVTGTQYKSLRRRRSID